jgi:hypothetical protein
MAVSAAPGADPAFAWEALSAELSAWRSAGRTARLFWRDDDAMRPGPALDRLFAVTAAVGAPLMLAVIPAGAGRALADAVAAAPHVSPVQHGWAHVNHGRGSGDKGAWELGLHRGADAVLDDLERGRERCTALFGAAYLPAIVPPWNRIDAALFPALAVRGWRGVSAFGRRGAAHPVAGFTVANAHVDPIRWKEGPRFAGAARTLAKLTDELAARRTGAADGDEAIGLLTHHLALDADGWVFAERLGAVIAAHAAARWVAPADLFAAA